MLELKNKWLKIRASKQGGSILSGVLNDGRAFLRPYKPSTPKFNIFESAYFPLVPLGNRVAGKGFEFNAHTYPLTKNSDASPFYIHGDGWLNLWQVESLADDYVKMTFEHAAHENSPYNYSVKQTLRLEQNSLIIELKLTNEGETLPFGLGMHPYFPRSDDMLFKAEAQTFWTLDESNLPESQIELTLDNSFTNLSKMLDGLDNCFSMWNRKAQIIYPENSLKIDIQASETFSEYLIYSPKHADYFCFEPMSHVPNGLNKSNLGGMQVLTKGESIIGQVQITVSEIVS